MTAFKEHEQSFQRAVADAQQADEQALESARQRFQQEQIEWKRVNELAARVVTGEHAAYVEALTDFNPFAELAGLGSSIHFTVHDAHLIECVLNVKGRQAVPSQTKSLTAAGKLSIKAMTKGRFHEIYQDYVCGCTLRIAREVFALLPVKTVLVTATVDAPESSADHGVVKPVLSVAMHRSAHEQMDYTTLDPSDAIEDFLHRGDFKASRKLEDFVGIVPLTPEDISEFSDPPKTLEDTIAMLRKLKAEICSASAQLASNQNSL